MGEGRLIVEGFVFGKEVLEGWEGGVEVSRHFCGESDEF